MLWVYGHYKYLTLTERGSTLDVRYPRCKGYVKLQLQTTMYFNLWSAKLYNLNFNPLAVVHRYRDPQVGAGEVGENYSYLYSLIQKTWQSNKSNAH